MAEGTAGIDSVERTTSVEPSLGDAQDCFEMSARSDTKFHTYRNGGWL